MSQTLIVQGRTGCFPRPEYDRDLLTYDVITPLAARGIVEAIYWTPAIAWQIERITVLHPIQTSWSPLTQD